MTTHDSDALPAGGAVASAPSERRQASWMALGTLLSRLTGFVRTAALVAVLGVTQLGNAFNTANTLPNMLLFLVTGGTISAVLIPMLARIGDPDERRARAEAVGGLVLVVTIAAAVLMLVSAPLAARLFASTIPGDASAFMAVTASWLALFAPQIVCYGVSVFAVAVLNAHGRLALAGFAPVATNVVAIAALAAYLQVGGPFPPDIERLGARPLVVLGLGTTLSVAAMALPQYLGAKRVLPGLRLRPVVRWRDPAIQELWRLGRWTLFYVAIHQVAVVVVITLANGIANGGVVAYQTAYAMLQLPFAIAAVSLLSALYPRMSRAATDDGPDFGAAVAGGLRLVNALMVPAAAGMLALAFPITDVLVGYGAAEGTGANLIAVTLQVFAFALVPFTIFQVLTRSFYAQADTRTPALTSVSLNLANVALALAAFMLLDDPLARLAALVGAYAVAQVVGALRLGVILRRRRPGAFAGVGRAASKALVAALVMVAVLLWLQSWWPAPPDRLAQLARTAALVAAGGGVYAAAAFALRSDELRELARLRRGR